MKLNPQKPLKRTMIKKKVMVTGELALFGAIAKVRDHVCFVTGEPVNIYKPDGSLDVNCFMHVVSKGSRPDLRLYDKNIQIALPRVHRVYDSGNEQERKKMEQYPGWHKLLALHEEMKSVNLNSKTYKSSKK